MNHPNVGTSLDDFLRQEGLYEDATARAIKKVIVFQLTEAMRQAGLSKAALARLMNTSRSQLDRLLDPDNTSLTLSTLCSAAAALGKDVAMTLVDAPAQRERD